ncbi:MAG: TIGR04282 family arsenosugar biosynthesis glycosyltransferase [Desulfobulbaceae bacterium]
MKHQKDAATEILLFTRYPVPGRAKTRLIPRLGAEGAAQLQARLTIQAVSVARQAAAATGARLTIFYTGGDRREMEEWLGRDLDFFRQGGGDLGVRILTAIRRGRAGGVRRTVVIGSDCPGLRPALLADALRALETSPLVLGPAADGGYYLIGVSTSIPDPLLESLFTTIDWGTSSVFAATLARAHRSGISPKILEVLHDIDRPEDLAHLDHHPDAQ